MIRDANTIMARHVVKRLLFSVVAAVLFVSCASLPVFKASKPKLEKTEEFTKYERDLDAVAKLIGVGDYFGAAKTLYVSDYKYRDNGRFIENYFDNLRYKGQEDSNILEAIEMLESLNKKGDGLSDQVMKGLAGDKSLNGALRKDFPNFYSFLGKSPAKSSFWQNLLKSILDYSRSNYSKDLGSKPFDSIESFQAHARGVVIDKPDKFDSSLRELLKDLSDFDFHDAMQVLEKDCYANLTKTKIEDLYYWGGGDCKVEANYKTKDYDYSFDGVRYSWSGDFGRGQGSYYSLYSGLRKQIEAGGVKFSYDMRDEWYDYVYTVRLVSKDGKWRSQDRDIQVRKMSESDLENHIKSADFFAALSMYSGMEAYIEKMGDKAEPNGYYLSVSFDGVPDKNKDNYELKIVGVRSK